MRRVLLILALAVLAPRAASPQGGAPIGREFLVNTYTSTNQLYPSVTTNATGNVVVVWTSNLQDGTALGSSGSATHRPASRSVPSSGVANFVVTWDSQTQDGSFLGVFGQRYGQIVPVELMQFGIE